jgi:hypothetical protein
MQVAARLHHLKSVHMNFQAITQFLEQDMPLSEAEKPAVLQQLKKSLRILQLEVERQEAIDRAEALRESLNQAWHEKH